MSKKLWIFEKPSVAKSVAALLPPPHKSFKGYITTGDGIVTWCVGHILEQIMPAEYDEKYKSWNFELLPILPEKWKLKPSKGKEDQLKIIKEQLKNCDVVVNGGDEGREGQLLVDEVLEYCNNKKPVLRYLSGATDKKTIMRSLSNLQDNKKFFNHFQSALGRSRADWLLGINMTMGTTSLASSQQGKRMVLSVGRVQTPTLGLIVKRDLEIENFKPMTYFDLKATFLSSNDKNLPFDARWLPKGKTLEQLEISDKKALSGEYDDEDNVVSDEKDPPYLKDNKLIDPAKAQEIYDKVKKSKNGVVLNYINKPAKEFAPLPPDLGELQKKMNIKYGHSVTDTLKACQSLYEKGYTTYPRTDCRYLPEVQLEDVSDILTSLSNKGVYEDLVLKTDKSIKSACWNDAKIGEHHAIIPTREVPDLSSLTDLTEKHAYEFIVKDYIAQFYPDCLVDKINVEIDVEGERFSTSGRVVVSQGWRVVFGANDDKKSEPTLPNMSKGEILDLKDLKKEEKQTTPPPHYTPATLVGVMQNIHRVLDDPEERKRLKGEGLGRSATRNSIIDTLYKQKYVENSGKYIVSTELGKTLISFLPKRVTSASLTAQWEKALDMIVNGTVTLSQFESKQREFVTKLLEELSKITIPSLPNIDYGYSGSGSKGKSSTSTTKKTTSGKKCPKCGKGNMVSKKVSSGQYAGKTFKGCSNYPECKHTEWPKSKK